MVDRCRGRARLDQLDSPPVYDFVVAGCGDCHGPAEMMRDADTKWVRQWIELALGRALSIGFEGHRRLGARVDGEAEHVRSGVVPARIEQPTGDTRRAQVELGVDRARLAF